MKFAKCILLLAALAATPAFAKDRPQTLHPQCTVNPSSQLRPGCNVNVRGMDQLAYRHHFRRDMQSKGYEVTSLGESEVTDNTARYSIVIGYGDLGTFDQSSGRRRSQSWDYNFSMTDNTQRLAGPGVITFQTLLHSEGNVSEADDLSTALQEFVHSEIPDCSCQGVPPQTVGNLRMNNSPLFVSDSTIPAFGDAWRDPSGMIWGDIVRNNDREHSVQYLVQSSEISRAAGQRLSPGEIGAKEYCETIGARLPSRADFARLRRYLGATTLDSETAGTGYRPNGLPNLHYSEAPGEGDYYFWSSTLGENYEPFVFFGRSGLISDERNSRESGRNGENHVAVRCVVQH